MKKKILITTSGERSTRILLRTEVFELLKNEYDIIIASPAEEIQKWKDEFKDVTFFLDGSGSVINIKNILKSLNISAIISCSNTDTPVHEFDVNFQKICKGLEIPVIIIQDFIDAIFHPMVIIPDLYLCWGDFFKRMFSRKRDVILWDPIGSLNGLSIEKPLSNVKVCGVPHFDTYFAYSFDSKETFVNKVGFCLDKPIFTYIPNGEISKWVYETFDNLMYSANIIGAQVVIKTHPCRLGDNWIYDLVTKNYKNVPVILFNEPSLGKGLAYGLKTYDYNAYKLDAVDSLALGNILMNSDIVCSIPSTSALEAMIFNKSVVLETKYWNHPVAIREKIMRWWWDVLKSYKCCMISKKEGELHQYIIDSLNNPNELINGRALLIQEMFNIGMDDKEINACRNIFNEIKLFLGS